MPGECDEKSCNMCARLMLYPKQGVLTIYIHACNTCTVHIRVDKSQQDIQPQVRTAGWPCSPAEADAALCPSCVDVLHDQGVSADHLHNLAHKGVTELGLAGVLQSGRIRAARHAPVSQGKPR